MKIIVVSDSHGNVKNIQKIIEDNPDCNTIIHAGDGALDINEFFGMGKTFYRVRGNCDGSIPIEDEEVIDLDGIKIFLTHGNKYRVSYTKEIIANKAKEMNCSLAIFGHTHKAIVENVNNVLLINPGTCNRTRSRDGLTSYAIIETIASQIVGAKIINL